MVERLFNIAKYIMTDHRKHMHTAASYCITPPYVGGWCRGGSAFEIKCPVDFAQLMLPKYLCKSDVVLLIAHESQRKTLVFRHPHFNHHKPHLMTKIKRKTNFSEICDDVTSLGEVDALRDEAAGMKAALISLSSQISQLAQLQ
ncbi:hypothetical protein B5M09_012420 [Aphanomyces astaci]|uniref:Uncharacterized protein n=1 Tax=Aphanomyces astaci TaxID=112090 RepID=A0A425DKY8_APHAT|nr:hypothetical protein B5M09_012420 [Aphanomyces astaci]